MNNTGPNWPCYCRPITLHRWWPWGRHSLLPLPEREVHAANGGDRSLTVGFHLIQTRHTAKTKSFHPLLFTHQRWDILMAILWSLWRNLLKLDLPWLVLELVILGPSITQGVQSDSAPFILPWFYPVVIQQIVPFGSDFCLVALKVKTECPFSLHQSPDNSTVRFRAITLKLWFIHLSLVHCRCQGKATQTFHKGNILSCAHK